MYIVSVPVSVVRISTCTSFCASEIANEFNGSQD